VELKHDHQHGADGSDDGDQHRHQHGAQGGERRPQLRRIEVITGAERRRRWSAEEKATITAESLEPGVKVAAVARRHGVSLGLLHSWRRGVRADG
jgi:transposase